MTTLDTIVNRARSRMMFGSRGPVYTLGSNYTAGATSLVTAETPEVAVGSIVSVDYELFYVTSVNVPSKTLTVIPGYLGTTQANHTTPAVIEVDARFPKATFIELAEEELRSWGRSLPRVTSVDLSGVRNEKAYDLAGVTGEVYHLLDVRREPTSGTSMLGSFSWGGDSWLHVPARLLREMNPGSFATGYAIQLKRYPRHVGALRVTVSQPLNLAGLAPATDLETTVGVDGAWLDILLYGMRMRALAGDVGGRTDWRAAGHARDAEETTSLDLIRATAQAADMRNDRFTFEAMEFRAAWPYRS